MVAGAVAGLTVCNGPVLFFTSGVFLKPIAADTHWQRSTTKAISAWFDDRRGLALGIAMAGVGLGAIRLGPDVYRPQPLIGPELAPRPTG